MPPLPESATASQRTPSASAVMPSADVITIPEALPPVVPSKKTKASPISWASPSPFTSQKPRTRSVEESQQKTRPSARTITSLLDESVKAPGKVSS